MKIVVGRKIYEFVSLRDVYEYCLKHPTYFKELVRVVENANKPDRGNRAQKRRAKFPLAELLLQKGLVLPQECFTHLLSNLTVSDWVGRVSMGLKKKYSFKRVQRHVGPSPEGPCPWPDCPDSTT